MTIRLFSADDIHAWDAYVKKHPQGTHAHLAGWKNVIEKTYNKTGYYLIAEDNKKIAGLLPLFHIKSLLFGNQMVSMPYLTYGGVLSESGEITNQLIVRAQDICSDLKLDLIELRHDEPLSENIFNSKTSVNTSKVSMRLKLPSTADELFNSFKAKLRSQIRRPEKEGMKFSLGGSELVDDFYKVFVVTMRDLGSPVHSIDLFKNISKFLGGTIKIGIVYFEEKPVAGGIITIFGNMVEIPWAASLREYNRFSPNMLLYWSLLEYSCNKGMEYFDFGRSTPGEGTFRFKEQWGSEKKQLYWYRNAPETESQPGLKRQLLTSIWAKLPVALTTKLGPEIRKNISL